jgi:hypothetical protein
MKAHRAKTLFFQLLTASIALLSLLPEGVHAQSETGYDIIAEVNALRAAQGLDPYTVDSWIMDYAQQHTQYQANNMQSTHRHSDGSYAWDVGLNENIAMGSSGFMSPHIAVYEIWQDWVHLEPMIGYASGAAGAGVAVGADGNVYYTLKRARGQPRQPEHPSARPDRPTRASHLRLSCRSSPNPPTEGVIIHIVGPGESLWGIAVSIRGHHGRVHRGLNGMAARSHIHIRRAAPGHPPRRPAPARANAHRRSAHQPNPPCRSASGSRHRLPLPNPHTCVLPPAPPQRVMRPWPCIGMATCGGALLTAAVGALLGAGLDGCCDSADAPARRRKRSPGQESAHKAHQKKNAPQENQK